MEHAPTRRTVLVTVLAGALLASCAACAARPLDGRWGLADVRQGSGRPVGPDGAWLEVRGDEVTGNDGTNQFSGRAERAGSTVRFVDVTATLMGRVGPDPVGAAFVPVLDGRAVRLTLDGDRLTLTAGGWTLRFRRT